MTSANDCNTRTDTHTRTQTYTESDKAMAIGEIVDLTKNKLNLYNVCNSCVHAVKDEDDANAEVCSMVFLEEHRDVVANFLKLFALLVLLYFEMH